MYFPRQPLVSPVVQNCVAVCATFSYSLLSAAKCEYSLCGALNTKRLALTRTVDERGSPPKPVRAAGPLVKALLSLPYTSIHRQSRDHPRGDGNSSIIPISSGNFVAQFVSRKEYDITRAGRIVATQTAVAAIRPMVDRHARRSLVLLITGQGTWYPVFWATILWQTRFHKFTR